MADLARIDGGDSKPIPHFAISPGETIGEVAERLGVEVTYTPLPELDRALVREAEIRERVSKLLSEYSDWNSLPDPEHPADDPCVECDALRIASRILE